MNSKLNFFSYIGQRVSSEDSSEAKIVGHVDHLNIDGIAGWIVDKSDFNNRLTIEVLVDGKCVVSSPAQLFRPDIKALGLSDGYSGFRLVFPTKCFDNKKHKVAVREANSAKLLTKSQITLKFPDRPSEPALIGLLEHLSNDLTVSGWAWLAGSDEAPTLDVYINDVNILSCKANIRRPDLTEVGLEHERAGFKIRLPKEAIKSVQCKIDIKVNNKILPGSPKLLALDAGVTAYITGIKHGKILVELSGWPGGALTGEMFVNGISAGEVCISKTIPGTNRVQGYWPIPERMHDAKPRVYSFVVHNDQTTIRCDPQLLHYPPYVLNIEDATEESVRGWAFRKDNNTELNIKVMCGGELLRSKQRNVQRPDVCSSFNVSHQKPGFSLQLAVPIKETSKMVALVDADTNIILAEIALSKSYLCMLQLASLLKTSDYTGFEAQRRAIIAKLFYKSSYRTRFDVRLLPRKNEAVTSEIIDIIIPVYKGYLETVECIESVLSAKNERQTRYIIINDFSPDQEINNYLEVLQGKQLPQVIIIFLTQNGGFPKAVNMGFCIAEEHDVILLNSDTVVFDGWVDRMAAAAEQPHVGTVTPFTNNGEICSLPITCKVNPVPSSYIANLIDMATAQLNAGKVVDLPVGVGFCMYIRRECLNEIGLFDDIKWGRGYGEEVDFCLKASAHGWRNVLCADTFVTHRGNVSFGDEKLHRILECSKIINKTFPFYEVMIEKFIKSDPMASLRRRVNLHLIATELPNSILHITHDFGGGTSRYVNDLISLYRDCGIPSIVLECKNDGASIVFNLENTPLVELFGSRYSESLDLTDIVNFAENLKAFPIDRVHVHTPLFMRQEVLNFIKENFIFDITVHDYAWICPRVTLSALHGVYCGEPTAVKCNLCIKLYGAHDGLLPYVDESSQDITRYRMFFADFFSKADKIYAGAADIVTRFGKYGFTGNFKSIPHPKIETVPVFYNNDDDIGQDFSVLNIAIIGAISDIKGFYIIHDCIEYAFQNKLPLHFTFFGYTMNDKILENFSNVTILGKYDEENLYDLIVDNKPILAFQPNQWPETFSYILNYCFELNLWPVVTDIGAPAERVRQAEFGTIIPVTTTPELIVEILLDVGAFVCAAHPKAPVINYPRSILEYTG